MGQIFSLTSYYTSSLLLWANAFYQMVTTTKSTTTAPTSFVEGLVDEILAELPFSVRIDLIFAWSTMFSTPGYKPDSDIVGIIGTITTLDFHDSQMINEETFPKITNLPFSSSLRHLNLSNTPTGKSKAFMKALGHPVFQSLETLDLEGTQLENLNPLLDAPHSFPNLQTLNLSHNPHLYISTIATTTKFPNLKVLDMRGIKLDSTTIEAFATASSSDAKTTPMVAVTTTTVRPQVVAPFQLEKLSLGCTQDRRRELNAKSLTSLSRSPHLTKLKELDVSCGSLTADAINQLFDPRASVLKNLTHLKLGDLGIVQDRGYSALAAVAQSPLLSNLVKLELFCSYEEDDPSKAETNREYLRQFINSPFLWTAQLKHLVLSALPQPAFVFDDLIPVLNTANVKLQTLNINFTYSSFNALSAASCLSELEELNMDFPVDEDEQDVIEAFIQSPILSKLKSLPHEIISTMTSDQLISLLSSPNLSNDLVQFDLGSCLYPHKDLIKTLCTQRVIPGDETSPLKYGKLRNLYLMTDASDDDIKLILGSLSQLTCLGLATDLITDKTITALLAPEREDPRFPYPSLPNLTHLQLLGANITTNGFIELSKPQLLDQLEDLNVNICPSLQQQDEDQPLPSGLQALLI